MRPRNHLSSLLPLLLLIGRVAPDFVSPFDSSLVF
jgi:hypothetical protein